MAHEKPVAGRSAPNILQFVNGFYLGGTEGQVVQLLRGLANRHPPLAATANRTGPLLEELAGLGIEPYEFSLAGGIGQTNTLWQIARLARLLREKRVGLVHAHDFYSAALAVPAAKLVNARVVVSRLDLAYWPTRVQRAALVALTRAADHVIANAEVIKRQLISEEKLPAARISVIPNGIDLERFDRESRSPPQAPLPPLEGKVVLAHVANMAHPIKAHEDLLAAIRWVITEHPQVVLLLIGDGPRKPLIQQMSTQMGLDGNVHFLGHRTDVPAILARSHVGVLCSLSEGLSNAVIEGMAAGLPMVVTDAGGNRELVRSGENGFVVKVKSPHRLAEKIRFLIASADLRRQMGKAARAFVERELPLSKLLARHETVYRTLLATRAHAEQAVA